MAARRKVPTGCCDWRTAPHIVKGFGVAIVRTPIMLAVAALGLSLTTVVLQLPYAVMDMWIFD